MYFHRMGMMGYLLLSGSILPAQGQTVTVPILIDSTFNLYQSGNIFLSGQPSRENLEWLSKEGVSLVINIRTAPEIEKFTASQYDEAALVRELNMDYLQAPVGGADGYKPETMEKISDAIVHVKGKVLIHCTIAARATLVWMAWLIRNNYCTIDEAVKLGEKVKFSFPLENLLGYPVHMEKAGN